MSACAAFSAEPKWVHVKSDDFEIFSSAGDGDTRRVLQYFERLHSFSAQLFPQAISRKDKTDDPVRIIVFGSAKDYQEYKPNQFADAYYRQTGGRDYIVLGAVSDNVFPLVVHEYMHLVIHYDGLNLPPWLNEGLAELYSTMKPIGDKVVIGNLIAGRVQALQRDRWTPLATIVGAGADSPYYNEKNKAGALYNEGWALTHMLVLGNDYAPKFPRLLEAITNGAASQSALESVYGKPLTAIEGDLQTYLRRDTFTGRLAPAKMTDGPKATVEPAPAFDVRLSLADLADRPDKEAETRAKLEELAAMYPKRPEPQSRLAYLDWIHGRPLEATREFTKGFDLGDRSPKMLWDYGRLAENSGDLADANRALSTLLKLEPGRVDVRLALAGALLQHSLAKEALETLTPVKSVSPSDAPRLFAMLAQARLQTGDVAAARADGLLWVKNAREPADQARANRFVKSLDSPAATPASAADSPESQRRQDAPIPSVHGTFTELDCSGKTPKAIFQTASGTMTFALADPGKVNVTGVGAATVDLNCGQQEASPVTIEYQDDSLRTIHFEK